MNELSLRAITGAIYVALTLGAAFTGPFTTFLLFLPVCGVAAFELHRLYWISADHPPPFWSVLMALITMVALAMNSFQASFLGGYVIALVFLLLLVSIAWMLLSGARDPAGELGGLLLVVKRTRPMGVLVVFPVMVGVLLVHLFVMPSTLPVALIVWAILGWLIYEYRDRYLALMGK